jgi:hypothetical protein
MSTRSLCWLLVLFLAAAVAAVALPDPKSGGKAGGPIDLLLLRGHSEWDFGRQPKLDATYQKMLADRGYRITETDEWRRLTRDYLQQFNTVIYIGPSACYGGGYFDMTGWRSGPHLLTVQQNLAVLRDYVAAGGGLLIDAGFEEFGTRTAESLQQILAPYGMTTECAAVRDLAHGFEAARIINVFPIWYSWSERIAQHPATAGISRVYYPSYCTRWDDNYTTLPLYPRDPAWTPLVQAMPGAQCAWLRSTIYDPKAQWVPTGGTETPAIIAARPYGKGRLAVTGISPFFLYYLTYAADGAFSESAFSRIDGIAMEKGDGKTPSDLHRLLDNLFRWLADGSLAAGMGGYAGAVKPGDPAPYKDDLILADTPVEKDPLTQGPVRPMRILVGAHSAMSDGAGDPAAWAKAAKTAGYDVVCFSEALEATDITRWPAFVDACAKASGDGVALLPGLDMGTDLGDRFLIVGHTTPIRHHLLTADTKQLFWTGHMLLGMGDVLPIAARPQRLAQVREKGALPPDLYSHCPGVAYATYRDGAQVDDGREAYRWNLNNASMPIAVAVHEVYAPDALGKAAATGLQNYVNADTPAHAAYFFRQGLTSFGGNPTRRYLSSGPLIDACAIDNWQSPTWTITLKAHDAQPITAVTVQDQYGIYRQFAPKSPTAEVSWHGNLGIQRWFDVQVTDGKGGTAILSPIRTLPRLNTVRCMDRQNWFTPLPWADMTYTGRSRISTGIDIRLPGVSLAAGYCPKFQMLYEGEGFVVHAYKFDSTLVPGGRDPGADNSPIFHDLPIPEYAGLGRYLSIMYGRSLAFREYLPAVTLKKDLPAKAPVWPVFTKATGTNYVYTDAAGKRIEGAIAKGGYIDLPVGGVAGNLLALTPLRVAADGSTGIACDVDGAIVKAGTTFSGAYVLIDPKKTAETRTALGFDGPTPFSLTMTQGSHARTALFIELTAKDYGAAGSVKGGPMPLLAYMPLRLTGANPRWPVGQWQPAADAGKPGPLTIFDCYEGAALGLLGVTKDVTFYFGNLLTATNPALNLAFAAPWTQEGTVVEVNNPTRRSITATISTPAAITDRIAVKQKVTVPAGGTVQVTVGKR